VTLSRDLAGFAQRSCPDVNRAGKLHHPYERGDALRTERSNDELVRSKVELTVSVQPVHSLGDRLQRGVARDVSQ
jgi:hypothetical protein